MKKLVIVILSLTVYGSLYAQASQEKGSTAHPIYTHKYTFE